VPVTLVPSQTDHNRQLHELAAVAPGGTVRSRTRCPSPPGQRSCCGNGDRCLVRPNASPLRLASRLGWPGGQRSFSTTAPAQICPFLMRLVHELSDVPLLDRPLIAGATGPGLLCDRVRPCVGLSAPSRSSTARFQPSRPCLALRRPRGSPPRLAIRLSWLGKCRQVSCRG
jgi:hypothetical protein